MDPEYLQSRISPVPNGTETERSSTITTSHSHFTLSNSSNRPSNNMTTTTLYPSAWRFLQPLERTCRVVFAGPHFQAGLQYTKDLLSKRNQHDIELIHAPTDDQLLTADADVALPFMQSFDREFLQQSPNLRLVMQYGVGLERVNVDEATRCGIAVSNIPASGTGNAQATSEHALLLSMSLLRYATHELPKRFHSGILGGLPVPRTLYRKIVTVVGYGAVGSTLCHYLVTLGAHVTAIRQREWCEGESDQPVPPGVRKGTTLKEALPTTDLLILACTLTKETWHLLNDDRISLLPRGALVVNVGRGPLVEYNAILKALQSGAVGGFASDVGVGHPTLSSEPWDSQDALSQLNNTIFTPHVGGYTDYSYEAMSHSVVDAIECVIRGEPPPVWVNKPQNGCAE
jgi:phosphoglycerate dehydrogenase-like enzyme